MTACLYTDIRSVTALWRMNGKTLCRACHSVLSSFHNTESSQGSQLLVLPCERQPSTHACEHVDHMHDFPLRSAKSVHQLFSP